MSPKLPAIIAAAIAIICSAIALNAPEAFPYLWIVKATGVSAAGLALLFTDPGKVIGRLEPPKTL